jgi:CRISPR system Cascade subunit CasA
MNRAGWVSLGLAAMGLAGCAAYVPAPPHPERFQPALEARTLGEQPPGATWSGADLLSAALARNAQIAEARANYLTALAAERAARGPPGPSLTLTAEYANEAPRWGYGGAGDIPLDYGARRGVRITAGRLQALQALYDYGEAVWSVRTALEKARIELTAADTEITLAGQAADARRQRAERLDQRVAAGHDARAVAITAQGDAVAAERRLSQARGRRDAALVDLAKSLGVSPAVAASLTLAPVAERAPPGDLAVLRRDAALSRRDVLRAVADYDLAENALRLEIANQYPQVSIGPGYNYDHGVTKLPFNLSLALPPYDLNRRAIAQAEAARAAAGRSLELAQANALAAVDTAQAALAVARSDQDRTGGRDVPAAERAADGAARAVKAGEGDRTDDLAARAALIEARLNLLDAESATKAAIVDLEAALRRSFDPAETAVMEKAMSEGAR